MSRRGPRAATVCWLVCALLPVGACGDDDTPATSDAGRRDLGSLEAGATADASRDAGPTSSLDGATPPTPPPPPGPPPPPVGVGCPDPMPSDWLFCDDFESGDLSRWTEHPDDPARLRVVEDAAHVRSGRYAMYVPAEASTGNQGGEATWRSWPTGYDELHLRFFVYLAEDFDSLHHFVHMGAARMDDRWSADGLAGCRPTGENFFSLTLDLVRRDGLPAPGKALLYTYWPDMTCEPGSVCARYADPDAICAGCAERNAPCLMGPECCWGNHLEPAEPVVPPLGRFVCMELSSRLNAPSASDGWAAFSIDGRPIHRQSDMRIRTSTVLELSNVRVGIYNTREDADGHANRAWFDDVAVSRAPIGCE